MGFQFKTRLATALAVINGISVATTYLVSQGDLTTVIVVQAIVNGIMAGVSYYKGE